MVASSLVRGFSEEELKFVVAYSSYGSTEDPAFEPLLSLEPERFALRREDFTSAARWKNTKHAAEFCRGANTGPFLYMGYLLKGGTLIGVGLHREWNAAPFSERDRILGDLLIQHFGPTLLLPERELTVTSRVQRLSPQLRRVLLLLLSGLSEKQVAWQMDLSRHTVHEYVKLLYRQFQVQSRPALAAMFLPSDGASPEGIQAWHALVRDPTFRQIIPARNGNRPPVPPV